MKIWKVSCETNTGIFCMSSMKSNQNQWVLAPIRQIFDSAEWISDIWNNSKLNQFSFRGKLLENYNRATENKFLKDGIRKYQIHRNTFNKWCTRSLHENERILMGNTKGVEEWKGTLCSHTGSFTIVKVSFLAKLIYSPWKI